MTATRPTRRLPDWLKTKGPGGVHYLEIKKLVRDLKLNTVCASAHCPNAGECWNQRTATFMILGDICTRNCGFCAVKTGRPQPADEQEPERVAEAVATLELRHAVITSVSRDDLPDGGAEIFARTIEALHRRCPGTTIEVLIPDFKGNQEALERVLQAAPDILNHNLETVPRLYADWRPQAQYGRSLELLERASRLSPAPTKSGMMLGAGETHEEIRQSICELAGVNCRILTLGQYLSPSPRHLPVDRFVAPDEFSAWRAFALQVGFQHVESGPLVRSSYHAERQLDQLSIGASSAAISPAMAYTDPTKPVLANNESERLP